MGTKKSVARSMLSRSSSVSTAGARAALPAASSEVQGPPPRARARAQAARASRPMLSPTPRLCPTSGPATQLTAAGSR